MPLGGRRPGAGRPPGSPNKRTAEVARAVAEAAERLDAAIPGAFAGAAHALLMSIYKDPARPIELRLDAAAKAIRYEKPALAAVDFSADVRTTRYDVSDRPLTAEEWAAEVAGRAVAERSRLRDHSEVAVRRGDSVACSQRDPVS